ncbi:MAG TPA: L-2-amino-thiazoline-4-carboxylic acid hydrolase [Vineibacter sp.]|nr:L-2-amino-thiazoline-4-carboxylic acid hydrolase [Vineibacter sp.]
MTQSAATPAPATPMGILERRRIEAEIIKPIYEEMQSAFGEAAAKGLIERAIKKAAIEAGRQFAAQAPGGPSLAAFAGIMPLWTQGDALGIEPVRQDEQHLEFNVTRCRYAEMYRAMGLGDIGHLLSCNRDGTFIEGYDSRISMQRTQTIMQGASHCDFRYRTVAEEK